jgi:hypothetical protein
MTTHVRRAILISHLLDIPQEFDGEVSAGSAAARYAMEGKIRNRFRLPMR